MKKIILIVVAICGLCFTSFAQLNIKSTSSKSETLYRDMWVSCSWNGAAFIMTSSDPQTSLSLTFTLGGDKASAYKTVYQIISWFDSAENKSSITFEDGGNDITLYKQDGAQIIISTGDAEFIRKEYSRRISGALAGTPQYRKDERTPHLSFITDKAINEISRRIWTLTDPKYIKGDPNDDPYVRQIKEREREYNKAKAAADSTAERIADLKKQIKDLQKTGKKGESDALKSELDKANEINKVARQKIREYENAG